jgi:hypothetical protein
LPLANSSGVESPAQSILTHALRGYGASNHASDLSAQANTYSSVATETTFSEEASGYHGSTALRRILPMAGFDVAGIWKPCPHASRAKTANA